MKLPEGLTAGSQHGMIPSVNPPEPTVSLNPFQPCCSVFNIRLDDVPVVMENLRLFEIVGSGFWLCHDVASLQSCVSRTDRSRVSAWFKNPGYAVLALKLAMETEG